MSKEIIETSLKCALVGSSGTGKTSIVSKYILNDFTKYTTTTIGGSYNYKNILLPKETIRLNIWDTAGQEKYKSLAPMYYRNANIIFIVCDITCDSSIKEAKDWYDTILNTCMLDTEICIIVNKIDNYNIRDNIDNRKNKNYECNYNDIHTYCEDKNIHIYDTSAKTGYNIKHIFYEMSLVAYDNYIARDYNPLINIKKEEKRLSNCFGLIKN